MTPIPQDIHSYAQPKIARVTHVDLDLTADFDGKTLSGTATLDITAEPGATEIVLDARNLDIRSITDAEGRPLRFAEGHDDPILGHALTVQLPAFAPARRARSSSAMPPAPTPPPCNG